MDKSTTTKPLKASANVSGAESIVDQAKDTAQTVASQAKETALGQIDQRKVKAVETIENVSSAIRGAGEKLEGTGPLPDLAQRAAEGIGRLGHYLENRSVKDLIRSAEGFARREPALFLGGAMVVGIGIGRFLKSSSHRTSASFGGGATPSADAYETYGYEGDYDGDFVASDDLADDYDVSSDEPLAFGSEIDRAGIGGDIGGGGIRSGIGSVTGEEPLRSTRPQGSTEGSVGVGSPGRGDTAPMPSSPFRSGGPSSKPGQS